jgi:hypothetical protein
MRRTVKLKIFISFFVFYYVFFLPVHSYALTFNQFMALTSSGGTKVATAGAKVATGVALSRAVLGFNAFTAAVGIALVLWDVNNRYKDYGKVSINSYSISGTSKLTSGNGIYYWGRQSSSSVRVGGEQTGMLCAQNDPCNCQFSTSPLSVSSVPAGNTVVGGVYVVTKSSYSGCASKNPWVYVGSWSELLYYIPTPAPSTSYVDNAVGSAGSSSDQGNTDLAVAQLEAAKEKLEGEKSAASGAAAGDVAGAASEGQDVEINPAQIQSIIDALQQAIDIMKNGVPVNKGDDYVDADPDGHTSIPQGQGPGEGNTQPDPPQTVPPLTDATCSDCVRRKHFSDIWNTVKTSAENAPILSLMNKLVINPGSSTFTEQQTLPVWKFGTVSFDLNAFHFSAIVAVIRFIVLGGAFIASYYIIFS